MLGKSEPSQLTFGAAQTRALEGLLASALGAHQVAILGLGKLGGGAIQENYRIDADVHGGREAGHHRFVLRTDAPTRVAVSLARAEEYAVLCAAADAGVRVPAPVLLCEDVSVLGRPFYVMRFVEGEALGRRLVRDPAVIARGEELAAEAGRQLGHLHRLEPPVGPLAFLEMPPREIAADRIGELRSLLDGLDGPQPVLEWGLRRLELCMPAEGRPVLIHNDFRTGNLLIRDGQLAAVLDWEFARYGDPREDLGWFLARCWRFGADEREAGGFGSREAFLDGYESAADRAVDRPSIPWFEVLAAIRWGTIALLQAARHRSGRERSLELALTTHVVPLLERDILQLAGEASL